MSGQVNDDDVLLSAYLDRELPQEDAERVRQRLAAEPALARRLQAMRGADDAVRHAFAAGDEAPLPQAVLDLLNDTPDDTRREHAAGGSILRLPARGARRWLQAPVAIAASVALLAGFLIHDLVRQTPPAADLEELFYTGAIPGDSELHQLLDEGVSGEAAVLPGGAEGRLLLTFESTSGDWCRQMALSARATSMQALACRRDERWEMEAVSFGPGTPPGSRYQPASSGVPAAVAAAVEARMGAGEPLAPEEEKQLISAGWEKTAQ